MLCIYNQALREELTIGFCTGLPICILIKNTLPPGDKCGLEIIVPMFSLDELFASSAFLTAKISPL